MAEDRTNLYRCQKNRNKGTCVTDMGSLTDEKSKENESQKFVKHRTVPNQKKPTNKTTLKQLEEFRHRNIKISLNMKKPTLNFSTKDMWS